MRLIRSKGVGVFFVTQTPNDVPDDVLAQLGNRVQHQLRAHTPNDAKALKATRAHLPQHRPTTSRRCSPQLGIGEAVVTVMTDSGAPTPVAWTRLRAPESLMAPTPSGAATAGRRGLAAARRSTPTDIDRESASEMLGKAEVARSEAEQVAAQ